MIISNFPSPVYALFYQFIFLTTISFYYFQLIFNAAARQAKKLIQHVKEKTAFGSHPKPFFHIIHIIFTLRCFYAIFAPS